MHDARLAGGFRSRRRGNQPETVRVRLIDQVDDVAELDVPRFEAPGLLILPTFALPGYLQDGHAVSGINITGLRLMSFGKNPDEFVNEHGAAGIQAQSRLEVGPFAQMLAKIGYSFAVAMTRCIGRDSSPVPDLLRDPANTGRWVGSDEYTLQSDGPGSAHSLVLQSGAQTPHGHAELAYIKLFANTGDPEGYVVVTRAIDWRLYEST